MGTDLVFETLVLAAQRGRTQTHDGSDWRRDHTAGRRPEETDGRGLDACSGDQSLVGYERDGSVDDGWIAGVDGIGARVCGGVYLWMWLVGIFRTFGNN